MTELYLVFIGIALLLFGAIVGYSVYRQKQSLGKVRQSESKQDYVDPLVEELQKNEGEPLAVSADLSPLAEPKVESATAQRLDKKAKGKSEPSLNDTIVAEAKQTATDYVSADVVSKGSNKAEQVKEGVAQAEKVEEVEEVEEVITESPRLDAASTIVTELVARVKNTEPIEQQALLKLFRTHDFKFQRKVHIYGLNELTDLWRDIEFELPSARFVELGVAIQLADRDGAMSAKELHDFQQMALDFSNVFNAPFEFSMDIDEAIKQARILDQIGRRYDSMAVLNVVPKAKSGFRMADIESCARDLMMSTDKNGIFVKTRGQKQSLAILYRLACTDGSGHFGVSSGTMTPVHDLVIYMNVPATEQPDRVFQDMVKDANSLATWLDGKVVDRNGKVMTQRSYSVLLQQISDITYSMQQDGITAGDAISKKLF